MNLCCCCCCPQVVHTQLSQVMDTPHIGMLMKHSHVLAIACVCLQACISPSTPKHRCLCCTEVVLPLWFQLKKELQPDLKCTYFNNSDEGHFKMRHNLIKVSLFIVHQLWLTSHHLTRAVWENWRVLFPLHCSCTRLLQHSRSALFLAQTLCALYL